MYREGSFAADYVRRSLKDTVVRINRADGGRGLPAHNPIWCHIPHLGCVHFSSLQSLRGAPDEALANLPRRGRRHLRWSEPQVCVDQQEIQAAAGTAVTITS